MTIPSRDDLRRNAMQCGLLALRRTCPMCEKIQELAVAFHVLGEKDTEIKALRAKLAESQALCERMQKGLDAVNALMNESGGVYGLHLNGDGASWDSLRTGGRFEEWLVEFDDALTTPKENNHES